MKYLIVIAFALVAVAAARPKSECEKHRDSIEGHEGIMKLIPKCEVNGDYQNLQCYEDSDFCVCYDKKGHPASPISTKIRHCKCNLQRHEKIKLNVENAYLPQCSADGHFAKKQCWDFNDSCWCVNEEGEKQGSYFHVTDNKECK